MKLIDYIKSDKRGKRANAIERQAHEDPFVADALEGYESIYDNHFDYLKELEQYVELRSRGKRRNKRRRAILWSVGSAVTAAAAIVCIVALNPGLIHSIGGIFDRSVEAAESVAAEPAVPGYTLAEADTMSAEAPETEASEVLLALYYDGTRHKITVPDHAYILNGEVVLISDAAVSGTPAYSHERLSEPIAQIYIPSSADRTTHEIRIPDIVAEAEISDISDAALLAMAENTDSRSSKQRESGSANRIDSRVQAASESVREISVAEVAVVSKDSVDKPALQAQTEVAQTNSADTPVSEMAPDGSVYVQNSKFERYFNSMRTVYTDESGNPLSGKEVIAEFRVNSRGTPSGIRIISSPSKNISKEVVNILSAYSVWEPTNTRIRTRVKL